MVKKSLRTLPALFLAALMVLCRYVPSFIEGAASEYWYVPVFYPLLGALLILIWWLTFSRATARERWLGLLGAVALFVLLNLLSHPSMAGILMTYLTLPMGFIGFGIAAHLAKAIAPSQRLKWVLAGLFLAALPTLFIRSQGITGEYVYDFQWRWSEEVGQGRWKADVAPQTATAAPTSIDAAIPSAEWPGFRGADRMGRAAAPKLATDWQAEAPKLLWKHPVGAAWSSFAVAGNYAFTMEQREAQETAVCYDVTTGAELWKQSWEARFDEPMGGPGPRATPTLADGSVFALGGAGALVRLKAATGEIQWRQDIRAVSKREADPMWGFSSSPLVVQGRVIVHAGGAEDKGVLAFDAATGSLAWSAACGPDSYSSPQLSRILGEDLVLMLTNAGLLALEPLTGKRRLDYEWKFDGYRALQPTVIGEDTLLLPTPMSEGTRCIKVSKSGDQLTATELWTSKQMKADFTELMVHGGYAYGIDGSVLACIDLKTGERQWKDGRYGKGEGVLLPASELILMAAEDGRVALVKTDPKSHQEVASIRALKGKTWNHPVVVGDKLLVRNASEAACYQLPLAK
jgi:outer membrane protein assembly factor BamB